MVNKISSVFLILLIGFTFVMFTNGLIQTQELISDDSENDRNLFVKESNEIQELSINTQPPIDPQIFAPKYTSEMTNNTYYYSSLIAGQWGNYTFDVPSESGKIYVEMNEYHI